MISRQPAPDEIEVARRLDAYKRTRDPAVLWPGLTERARVAAVRELERVTRQVLNGGQSVPIDPKAKHDPYALRVAGHTTGMGAVVGRWIEDNVVAAAPAVECEFAEHLMRARKRFVRMEAGALPALDALRARGVEPTILKGWHTARAYFDEPGTRRMSDADLLVQPEQIDTAEAALLAADFRPDSAALRPYKRDWIANNVEDRVYSVELSDERSIWGLELHASLDRTFLPGAVAKLDDERGLVERFEVQGRAVTVLTPPLLLLYLACHCSQELDGMRLLRVFELVRVIRHERAAGRLDWDAVVDLMGRSGTARYAFPALALVESLAPATVDRRILRVGHAESTWAARHTVARLAPAGGSMDERGVIRQLMWTRGPVAIADRLLRNLWPASLQRPMDVVPGWRVRLRRLRTGTMSLRAPDERP